MTENLLSELLKSIRFYTSVGGQALKNYSGSRWSVCQCYLAAHALGIDVNNVNKKTVESIDVGDPAIVHKLNDAQLVEYHALVVRRYMIQM